MKTLVINFIVPAIPQKYGLLLRGISLGKKATLPEEEKFKGSKLLPRDILSRSKYVALGKKQDSNIFSTLGNIG